MTPEQREALAAKLEAMAPIPTTAAKAPSPPEGEVEGGASEPETADGGTNFWDTLMGMGKEAYDLFADTHIGAAAGLAEGLSRGNAAPFAAGFAENNQGGYDPKGGLMGGMMNVASNVLGHGEPAIDDTKYQSMLDEATGDAPVSAALGSAAGTIAPYLLGAPETLLARLAFGAASGSGDAALTAQSTGKDPANAAKLGGLLGIAGQGTAEIASPLAKWALKSDPGSKVLDTMKKAVTIARGTGDDFPVDELSAKLAELGPGATIADLPEYAELAKTVMYDPKLVEHVQDLSNVMTQRLTDTVAPKKALQTSFKEMVEDVAPQMIDRSGNMIDDPRTISVIKADIKAQKDALVPQFDKILDDHSSMQIKRSYLTDSADKVFERVDVNGVPVSPTEGAQKQLKFIQKRLVDFATAKQSPEMVKAWEKGVAQAKRLGVEPPPPPGFVNPRDIQTLRRDLNKRIGKLVKTDPDTARQTIAYRDMLTKDILEELPGYKGLNKQWRDEETFLKAAKDGQAVLTMSPEELADLPLKLSALEDGDKQGFVEGVFRGLNNHLSDTAQAGRLADKLTNNDGLRQAFELIIPGKSTQFLKQLEVQMKLLNTASTLTTGSARSSATAAASLENVPRKFAIARIIGGVFNQIFPGKGLSSASATSGVQQVLPLGISPKAAEPLGKMLASQGPEAQSLLQSIGASATPEQYGPKGFLDELLESRFPTSPGIASSGGAIAYGQGNRSSAERRRRAAGR